MEVARELSLKIQNQSYKKREGGWERGESNGVITNSTSRATTRMSSHQMFFVISPLKI